MWENLQQRIDGLHASIRERENEIAEVERECEKLRNDLAGFEKRYNRIVKPIADQVEAVRQAVERLRELQLQQMMGTGESVESLWRKKTANRPDGDMPSFDADDFLSSADKPQTDRHSRLKTLFRKLARRYHPDLAQTDDDRDRRHRIMSQINTAYQDGDLESLEALDEATPTDEQFMLDEMLPMAVMVIRRLQRKYDELGMRLRDVKVLRHELRYGHLMELKMQEALARQPGRRNTFLHDIADELQKEYWQLVEELNSLRETMQ